MGEHGVIRNSVNFPDTQLPRRSSSSTRLVIVNENTPGGLGAITTACGTAKLNIQQTVNTSRGDIAYNVVDFSDDMENSDYGGLQDSIQALDGVISSRILFGGTESVKWKFF